MNLAFPDAEILRGANDATPDDLPCFVRVRRKRDLNSVDDVGTTTREAVAKLPLDSLSPGAEVAITAGSREVHDMPAMLSAAGAAGDSLMWPSPSRT